MKFYTLKKLLLICCMWIPIEVQSAFTYVDTKGQEISECYHKIPMQDYLARYVDPQDDTLTSWPDAPEIPVNTAILFGEFPENIKEYTALKKIFINGKKQYHDSSLSGKIPDALSDLSQLETLYITNGYLTGAIPESLFKNTHLKNVSFLNQELSECRLCELTHDIHLGILGNPLTVFMGPNDTNAHVNMIPFFSKNHNQKIHISLDVSVTSSLPAAILGLKALLSAPCVIGDSISSLLFSEEPCLYIEFLNTDTQTQHNPFGLQSHSLLVIPNDKSQGFSIENVTDAAGFRDLLNQVKRAPSFHRA